MHGVIAGLNIVIKDPENHNLIAVDHSGLEAVIGLNRKQRVIAMKPFFDLLVGVYHIIQKHSFAAIQGVTKGAIANESLKENIESELEDLEKELQCKITLILFLYLDLLALNDKRTNSGSENFACNFLYN